jgi:type II secretory pathway pseudopilin PulG
MPAKRTAIFNQGRGKQHGAVLMIMLVILIVSIAAILVNSLSSATLKNARQKNTSDALAQAKDALIGFAITYGDTHSASAQVHGYLPCPDIDGRDLSNNPAEGSAKPSCGSPNISVIGRLPWATLDLSALRDGDGECLWYAVSGTYKYYPPTTPTSLMNWDTNGLLAMLDASGTTIAQNVVAVIFAPGAVLGNQVRSAGGSAPTCGGNYTAAKYLDSYGAINNAIVSGTANAISQFGLGASTQINDQMIFITKQDIWNVVKKRNDFGFFVTTLLNAATTCALLPVTVNFDITPPAETSGVPVGSLKISRVPKTCLASPLNNWQDNLLYARCTSGSKCLIVNSISCTGVVIFSGERNVSQTRITNADKNTWSNYLEDTPFANLTAFKTGGTSFSGASSYSTASPSTDVLACIP